MKKITILIIIMTLLGTGIVNAAEPGAPEIGDPFDPNLGNGGYDVQHYDLGLEVDMDNNVITGNATIELIATQDLSTFNLDFRGMEIDDVLVNDESVPFSREGDELRIEAELAQDEAATVLVIYSGTPEPYSNQLATVGWVRYEDGIYVAGQPTGAATWFPNNNHPLDKATYHIAVTVPQPYDVASNGILTETVDKGESTTYVWETDYPVASYLIQVAIAEFDVQTETTADGLPIRNYLQADIAPIAAPQLVNQAEMIEFYSEIFGEYPFEAYGAVYVDADLGFTALETQTMSLFGRNMFRDPTGGAENVVAHELVHQWFGNSVSLTNWQDIWLNEGFATYGSFLWVEHQVGRAALDRLMEGIYQQLLFEQFTPGAPLDNEGGLFNFGVYIQGAWVLHALRIEVGDEAFFDIIKTYATEYQYGNATTEDFIAVSEDISGEDLGEFFDAWLYDGGVPPMPSRGDHF